MKQNETVDPRKESSKDDSSDVEKVKQHKTSAPPEAKANPGKISSKQREDEDAQKGHA